MPQVVSIWEGVGILLVLGSDAKVLSQNPLECACMCVCFLPGFLTRTLMF